MGKVGPKKIGSSNPNREFGLGSVDKRKQLQTCEKENDKTKLFEKN